MRWQGSRRTGSGLGRHGGAHARRTSTRRPAVARWNLPSIWVGFDEEVSHGIRVAVLKPGFELCEEPIAEVAVSTTVTVTEASFPLIRWKRTSKTELSETM